MEVLFIIDPLVQLKAYKDSSVAIMRALQKRGHSIFVASQGDLYIQGQVYAQAHMIRLDEGADLSEPNWWTYEGGVQERRLDQFAAAWAESGNIAYIIH